MGKEKDLTAIERDKISRFLAQKYSCREIAKQLNRSKSAICSEIKRNSFLDEETGIMEYSPSVANRQARMRRSTAGENNPKSNYRAINYALKNLKEGWSPEIIYGRVKIEYPNDKRYWMCPEAIYQLIYSKKQVTNLLWECLARKQQKRRKRNGRKVHRRRIPQRVSIHQRPIGAENRSEFGHWEGDTVEGKGHRDGVHTEVERLSRLMMVAKVDAIDSKNTLEAQLAMFSKLPLTAIKSTTLDNGRENHKHYELHKLNMNTYFADPYSSWQRGTNEWHNGLLRRYFPKGTDFSKIEQWEIDEVVYEINNRPRKVLQFLTPLEVFNLHICP